MKIKPDDYRKLRNAVHSTVLYLEITPEHREKSPKFLRWLVVRHFKIRIFCDDVGIPRRDEGDLALYSYLNDDHIDTALRAAFKELGYEWASQK